MEDIVRYDIMQRFKNVIILIYERQDLEEEIEKVIDAWSLHTDSLSYFRLLKCVIFESESEYVIDVFRIVKKRLIWEFSGISNCFSWTLGVSDLIKHLKTTL